MTDDVRVEEAAAAVRRRWPRVPLAGLILGTGLGRMAEHIRVDETLDYCQVPHLVRSTAPGHRGQLVCGTLAGRPVLALEGRCHLYEGYSRAQLVLPVQVLCRLGARVLFLSNASGGLNPGYAPGDVMLIDDHVDLMFGRRAGGATGGRGGPAGAVYDPRLIAVASAAARRANLVAHRGVYVAVSGPNYETRAEYRFLRRIGGDAVGMSTVPEATAAARCGLRTLAISVVTNAARPDRPRAVQAGDVLAVAEAAEANVRALITACLAEL